ncbi:uncharacterized protein LOC122662880 [Telopea speciosissima]|uniref:uncharacterized protein LOC122662880 n=1 Tax=Telopea speciosissima TaxID=54955 RepID=UPI001CC5E5A9|nr:uncharacterized protein LOC122662880 [Telopea speciosissima]
MERSHQLRTGVWTIRHKTLDSHCPGDHSANQEIKSQRFCTRIVGLIPRGSPSRNSRWPERNPGQGGGLEIVFNQQLTRLG